MGLHTWKAFLFGLLLLATAITTSGCGGNSGTTAVKQDELTTFLQENPQTAESSNLSE